MISLNAKIDMTDAGAAMRTRILQAVREGMAEAMKDLAQVVAEAAPERTGRLREAILASPKVTENSVMIMGTVSGDVGARHVGWWQEKGIVEGAAVAKRAKAMRPFFAGGIIGFIHSHGAFAVPGRPFMRPALDRQRQAIFNTIRAHIAEAVAV